MASVREIKKPMNAGEAWVIEEDRSAKDDAQQHLTHILTGHKIVDGILPDGLQYGQQVCISATDSLDSKLIGNLLISSHLRMSETTRVTIVDTNNTFDVRALARIVERQASSETVHTMLGRVKLIKTFDFDGVRESLDKTEADLQSNFTRMHLLVFDGLSQGVGVMFKNNAVQAQAKLDSFFKALSALSAKCTLLSILVEGFVQSRDVKADHECLFETSELQPFFTRTTAPGLDVNMHVHSSQSHKVLEIVASRHDACSKTWVQCEANELQ